MITLGIDDNGSDVYEGGAWLHAIYPPPMLMPISFGLADTPPAPSQALDITLTQYIFREDSFDPTSRIKRGRVYIRSEQRDCGVYPHPARLSEVNTHARGNGIFNKRLIVFYPYQIVPNLRPTTSKQVVVMLGTEGIHSTWLVVNFEKIYTGEELLTLRSTKAFGALPTIKTDLIPESGKARVLQTSEKLSSELNKATPESVIDRTRELMVAVLTTYLQSKNIVAQGNDLAVLANKLDLLKPQEKKNIASNAAKIIALLHARGKVAEQERRDVRLLVEQDAELAVSCVGVTLCDMGWGEWI